MKNDVVIYQSSDGLVKMEAIVDASNETIWTTQKAMAELFGIDLSGVSRHISNIYDIGELERDTTLAKFATLVQSGFRGTISKEIEYYNLDVIIAVGYRINSVKATAFRKWATSILKDTQRNIVRAIAVGATEMRSRDRMQRKLSQEELLDIVAENLDTDKNLLKIEARNGSMFE